MVNFDLGFSEPEKYRCDWCWRLITRYIVSSDNRILCKTEDKECFQIGTKRSRQVSLRHRSARLTNETPEVRVEPAREQIIDLSDDPEGTPPQTPPEPVRGMAP